MQPSPYTPGEIAPEVFGREQILEDIRRDLAFIIVEPRFVGRIQVFAGPRGVGKTSVRNSVRKHCPGAVCELVNVRDERGTLVGCEGVVRDKATGKTLGVRVDQGRATVWDDESVMLCWASDVGQSVAWLMSDPIGEFEALND